MITVIRLGHGSIDKCLIIYSLHFMISICFQNRPDPLILPPAAQTEIILIKCKVQYYNEGTPRLLCIMSATEITDNTIAGYQPQHTRPGLTDAQHLAGRDDPGPARRLNDERHAQERAD